jgi:hypothetical protein
MNTTTHQQITKRFPSGTGHQLDDSDAATRATRTDAPVAEEPAIRHVPGKRGPKSTDERAAAQAVFLRSFSANGNITASCRAAQVARGTLYEWLEHDEAFGVQYHSAKEEAVDVLEAEAYRRAVQGVERYVVSMGKVVRDEQSGKALAEREYSDTLLLNLLRAHSPKFRDSRRVELTGADGGPLAIEVNDARAELLQRINKLAERTAPPGPATARRGHREDAAAER